MLRACCLGHVAVTLVAAENGIQARFSEENVSDRAYEAVSMPGDRAWSLQFAVEQGGEGIQAFGRLDGFQQHLLVLFAER